MIFNLLYITLCSIFAIYTYLVGITPSTKFYTNTLSKVIEYQMKFQLYKHHYHQNLEPS
jgi:hypothetical protein